MVSLLDCFRSPINMTKNKTATPKKRMIQGVFVDPYRQSLSMIEIADDIKDWHKLLRCRLIEPVRVASGKLLPPSYGKLDWLELWCDEEFLLHDKPAPAFHFVFPGSKQDQVICGYAFICGCDRAGNNISFELDPAVLPIFASLFLQLGFEKLSERFPGEDFIEQRMRNLKLDLKGRVREFGGIMARSGQ
jgi:hypothetical protein